MTTVSFGPQRQQPDPFSCGASAVVVARMLLDPTYATRADISFHDEVIRAHSTLVTGTWRRRLGTPPWSVAWAMESLTGRRHQVRRATWQRIKSGTAPMPLLVGAGRLPRHYLLITDIAPGSITAYDPADGNLHAITAEQFTTATLNFGRWHTPLLLIAPTAPGNPQR